MAVVPRIHNARQVARKVVRIAASGGRYGALLFATYAVVLGIAEFATIRSAR